MGNCVGRKSSMVWGDDDERESIAAKKPNRKRQRVVGKKGRAFSSSSTTAASVTGREVTIKMTKKQLEELLGRLEESGVPVDQVLTSLMDATTDDHFEIQDQRSWRPTLQSIPEMESRG